MPKDQSPEAWTELPPGTVHTVRIDMRPPHTASRHILIPSGWTHDHCTACLTLLPMNVSEVGTAEVAEIECPRCRDSREFAAASEPADNPTRTSGPEPPAPEPPAPAEEPTPGQKRSKGGTKPRRKDTSNEPKKKEQGSLF